MSPSKALRWRLCKTIADAMRESRVLEIHHTMESLAYRKMYFEEFCAAAISIHQLEAVEAWNTIATAGFQHFETEGNRGITMEELERELNVGASAYGHLRDWVRSSDGKLSSLG
ncbi:hypothetical protein HA466_0225880 [Hirschfeldia incana]|nr:hypothetical protein HA466_0225880 [Hirschfeldia incana]